MTIRNALPFEFPFRWNDIRRFVDGLREGEPESDEAVDFLDQRDRDLEDFLATLGGGGGTTVPLPIPGGVAPDGSGTGNTPASVRKVVSSAGQTSNTPKVSFVQLAFDKDTDEYWMWSFVVPSNYSSGGTLHLLWSSSVTSGTVAWKAGAAAGISGATSMSASAFAAADSAAAATVPGTAGVHTTTDITLTTTDWSPGRQVVVFVGRDAGSDTAAGDANLERAFIEFEST